MIVNVLFGHKNICFKEKSLYYFHKKLKIKKNKKHSFSGVFRWFFFGFFWVGFFGWVFYCQPWKEEEEEDDGDLSKYDLWGNEEEGGGEDKNGKGEGKEGKEAKKKKSRSRSSSR
jgi:hypothetical protein